MLAGGAAIEQAAKVAGFMPVGTVYPGRADALARFVTDVLPYFAPLEPTADGFQELPYARLPAESPIDKASLLDIGPYRKWPFLWVDRL